MTETLKHARGMRACNTSHAWPSETFLVNSEYSSVKVGAVSKAELELSHSNVDGAAEPDSYAAVLPTHEGGDAASQVVAAGGPVGTGPCLPGWCEVCASDPSDVTGSGVHFFECFFWFKA